jgi:hypothetical protein
MTQLERSALTGRSDTPRLRLVRHDSDLGFWESTTCEPDPRLRGLIEGPYLPEVDAHYDRAKAAGAEIVVELRNTEYGSREYSARDPEGHVWHFGTYLPEM